MTMPNDEKIFDIHGNPVVAEISASRQCFSIATDGKYGRDGAWQLIKMKLSDLPKIQRRLADIAAEVKGED